MKHILIFIIKIYQKTLSFDHGFLGYLFPNTRVCIYHPSCSSYSLTAIRKYGSIIGSFLALKRIVSCNPFSKGGNDPVKEIKFKSKFLKFLTKI